MQFIVPNTYSLIDILANSFYYILKFDSDSMDSNSINAADVLVLLDAQPSGHGHLVVLLKY